MLFDWFTVCAQLINFVILLWLMKHFLYQPILDAIDAREARIVRELSNAAAKQAEAESARNDFQSKNEQFDQQRQALMTQAANDAAAERQRLFDEARKAADTFRSMRLESLKSDGKRLNQVISRRAQQEVIAISRKVLADLASVSVEERVIAAFLNRVREMAGSAKEDMTMAIQSSTQPVIVRSAFDVSPEQQTAIRSMIDETFHAVVSVRFETTPELISGIEFCTNGQKVAWSVSDYLVSLEDSIGELLDHQTTMEKPSAVKVSA